MPIPTPRQFHPETTATARAHRNRTPGSCLSDRKDGPQLGCNCVPDPDDLREVWAGRARMARGRVAAGVPLDEADVTALEIDARLT